MGRMASGEKSAGALEEASKPTGTYIREVILENFMSHEYSRVTLSPGLNVITGPNGAGKSSILLGIAVALGQTYTDRAGRLSDLIRRGEKAARLTVVFDNTEVDGKRPIPWLQSDQLVITRYLKRRLEGEKRRLELEYAWALVSEAEASANKLRERIEALMLEERKLLGEIEYHEGEVERIRRKLLDLVDAVKRGELVNLEGFGKDLDILLEEKGLAEVAKYRLQENRSEQRRLGYELNRIEKDLAEKLRNASALGERVKTSRKPSEILEDIRAIGLQIVSLGEVFKEAEDMYLVADARYRETEQRSMELEENLKKAMEELEYRKELWRRFLRELVKDVEPKFNSILSIVDGRGSIVLKNLEDPEKASIELHVGFRGAEPVILDAQTHSGGERIVGTLAFLLALQRYIKSPFRAVDEFDVHLDPLNRERMIKLLMNVAEQEPRSQYIIITPGRIPVKEGVNVILVQNVGGKSMIGRPE
jgi:chromosome segregation protein